MHTKVIEATEEHEEAVRGLFASVALPVREALWARTLNPEAPEGCRGKPWVSVSEADESHVFAFVMTRQQRLYHQGNSDPAQILYDFLIQQDDDGLQAGRQLLDSVCQHSSLNLAAGWSLGATEVLRSASWKHIANIPRWRLDPPRRKKKGKTLPPPLEPPTDPSPVQSGMAGEGLFFLERSAGADRYLANNTGDEEHLVFPLESDEEILPPGAFFRLRAVASDQEGRREWQLVDFRGTEDQRKQMVKILHDFVQDRGEALYVSCLGEKLASLLQEKGAQQLISRWGLFARLGDLSLRDLIIKLTIETPWNLFPADFDLDVD